MATLEVEVMISQARLPPRLTRTLRPAAPSVEAACASLELFGHTFSESALYVPHRTRMQRLGQMSKTRQRRALFSRWMCRCWSRWLCLPEQIHSGTNGLGQPGRGPGPVIMEKDDGGLHVGHVVVDGDASMPFARSDFRTGVTSCSSIATSPATMAWHRFPRTRPTCSGPCER
jgi:hypothetical protein